jgi:hypothetical protein
MYMECIHAWSVSLFWQKSTSNLWKLLGTKLGIKLKIIYSFHNPIYESIFNHYVLVSSMGLN